MAIDPKELPGWTFNVDETSANVFKVVASDSSGCRFEKSGTDPDLLLEEAKQYVRKLITAAKGKGVK